MNFLVTGGTGFIGSYVVRDLLKEGHEVVCLQRSGITPLLQELVPAKILKNVKIVQGTIADYRLLDKTMKQHKVENIIHLAACMIPDSESNIPLALQSTIIGTNNVFEAARVFKIKRIVWGDSCSIFGNLGGVFGKNLFDTKLGVYAPTNFYGATKSLCEFMAKKYIENYDMDIISLRYWRVYGHGKNTGGGALFTEFIRNVALGNPVTIKGGDTSWAYLYVEDAASATTKASQVPFTKDKFFDIHDGREYNGLELAEILKELNPKIKVTIESGKAQYDLPKVDCSLSYKELGFTPRSLKDGLTMFANYFRK